MTDSVVAIAMRRKTRANETGRCAVLYPALYPAIAEATHGQARMRPAGRWRGCQWKGSESR